MSVCLNALAGHLDLSSLLEPFAALHGLTIDNTPQGFITFVIALHHYIGG
jgi:hypothetical protein